ncbi:hypothetical protein [Desulfitibacter alkalitolerans]|uniref:hypothetical protein n=1 Tax=Desulfitibacter alkalitolerans TaxID=264641 RepID=UPI000484706B|nr:hypothetical protein [Desulfitibacter alkalitolerans]
MKNISFTRFISKNYGLYEVNVDHESTGFEGKAIFNAKQPLFLTSSLLQSESVLCWLLEHCRFYFGDSAIDKIEVPNYGVWNIVEEMKGSFVFKQGNFRYEKKSKLKCIEYRIGGGRKTKDQEKFLKDIAWPLRFRVDVLSLADQDFKDYEVYGFERSLEQEVVSLRKIVENFEDFPLFCSKREIKDGEILSRQGVSLSEPIGQFDDGAPLIASRLEQARIAPGINKRKDVGFSFASESLMALCWAELYWCAVQGLKINKCKHCGKYFADKRKKTVCERKCSKIASEAKDGKSRWYSKQEHQELTNAMKKVRQGDMDCLEYYKKWEQTSYAKHRVRVAWKVHPFRAVLLEDDGSLLEAAKERVFAEEDMGLVAKWLSKHGGTLSWTKDIIPKLSKEISGGQEMKQEQLKMELANHLNEQHCGLA